MGVEALEWLQVSLDLVPVTFLLEVCYGYLTARTGRAQDADHVVLLKNC